MHQSSFVSSSSSASSDVQSSSTSGGERSRTPNVQPGPVDPADGPPQMSREEGRRLVNMGPYQPRLAHYPKHEHGGQKRSFQAKWFDLPQAKEWLEYSSKTDTVYRL